MYKCPVCGYGGLRRPADDDIICPSCGTQFGYTDATRSHAELRRRWLSNDAPWYSRVTPPPPNWNPYDQLFSAGLGYDLIVQNAGNSRGEIKLETDNYRTEQLVIEILPMTRAIERNEVSV